MSSLTPPGPGTGSACDDPDNPTAIDPNEKLTVAGFGPARAIAGDLTIPYRINFENIGPGSVDPRTNEKYTNVATAPAQRVTITDQLSTNYDWSTFRLAEMGFGDTIVSIPDGSTYYEGSVNVTYGSKSFAVELSASINLATGRVFAAFQTVDPETGLPPDVLTGFLLPESGDGRGKGFFSFTIRPKADLPNGTVLKNVALISFDSQTFIATNQSDPFDPLSADPDDPILNALNTIDKLAPVSTVMELPASVSGPDFAVKWNGSDGQSGAGVATYDLFVSVDGAAFTPWLTGTTLTESSYTGELGKTYAFFSVATDGVGNRQASSLSAQASTTVTSTSANQAPTSISLATATLAENSGANAVVGPLSTVDPNANDTHVYTLVSGATANDNARFTVESGTLRAVSSFDYESQASYVVRVRSTDSGGLFVEKEFTIAVANVNETPTNVSLSANSIAENAGANALVGTLATSDPDTGDAFVYHLVSGTGDGDNAKFRFVGSQLQAIASLDFESQTSHSIRVRSTDAGGLFIEKQFTISVANVNEAPTVAVANTSRTAAEGGAVTNSGTFGDPEGRATVVLTASEGTVTQNNATGAWNWTRAVTDGPAGPFTVTITATDAGGLMATRTFTYSVTNVAPTLALAGAATVVAGSVYSLTLSSSDPGSDTLSGWTIQWGDATSSTLAGNAITATHTYSTPGSYTITATAMDEDGTYSANNLPLTVLSAGTPATTDIRVNSFTANGTTTLTVAYTIAGDTAPAFAIGFYRSEDEQFGVDTLLSTVSISALADRTAGMHTKTWTIGSQSGQIALPGAGLSETDGDYFLLAVADPTDVVFEQDATGTQEDNVASFIGSYFSSPGPVMIHGGAANDAITVSGALSIGINGVAKTYASAAVTGLRIRTHGGNDSLSAAAYTKPVAVFGGDGADTLTTGTAADLLSGGAGDDSLTGGKGNDVYLFDADSSLGTDTLTEVASGGGIDRLDFSPTSLAVDVNLGIVPIAGQTVNPNLVLKLNAVNSFEELVGGDGNDKLQGNALANLLVGRGGNDRLTGDKGNDTYAFDVDMPLGTDELVETASSGGTDLLSFADTTTVPVAVNLALATEQTVHATNLKLILGSASLFENVTGGSLGDMLTGNALANVLLGGAGNDSLGGGAGNDTLEGQAGSDSLTGEAGNDLYRFDADSALGSDTITEAAGVDIDSIDFALTTTQAVTLNLGLTTLQTVNGNLSLTLSAADGLENLVGGALADTLTGNSLANRLTGGPGNDSLAGGDGDDTYVFDADIVQGSDSLVETAPGGNDTLDFALTTTKTVSLNLGSTAAQVISTGLTVTLSGAEVFEHAVGGSLADVITGNGQANRLTGNAGNDKLVGGNGNDVLIGGAGNDDLQGGDGDDTYSFTTTSALGTDTLTDTAGIDLLDFSASTAAVTVNLAVTAAQIVSANLSIVLGAADAFEMVIGSSGADKLYGNALSNILIGAAGNDQLFGLGGRDLLFGGAGADRLEGGDDEDILAGGLFAYYNEATKTLNRAALDAVRAEWTRLDLAYAARINNLRNGGGLNGSNTLSSSTVLTDGTAIDTLFGQASLDWFWKFGADAASDLNTGGIETVN